ncbi:UrcA family protein [Sphingomonas cavernae]|uniref:UrcA family protein n=1 Tax=Sphingomonas cavernae TaxID=2320861 RepID=A0A418WRT9_9SPHN|nr:UrcA family protein [Sphingomonas cavernae]RJF93941.1 UrcA family protein [Sphingomonas cavernae]
MYVKTCAAIAAALAGATLLHATAFAGEPEPMVATAPPSDARSIAVSYADLDLTEDKSVDRLNTRVRHAARTICEVGGIKPVKMMQLSGECYDGAMDRATRDIEIAVASARSGDQLASNVGATGHIGVSRQ